MEVTGPQMVLTMKLTTFAWNVLDGRSPTEVRDWIHAMSVDLTDRLRTWTNGS